MPLKPNFFAPAARKNYLKILFSPLEMYLQSQNFRACGAIRLSFFPLEMYIKPNFFRSCGALKLGFFL